MKIRTTFSWRSESRRRGQASHFVKIFPAHKRSDGFFCPAWHFSTPNVRYALKSRFSLPQGISEVVLPNVKQRKYQRNEEC